MQLSTTMANILSYFEQCSLNCFVIKTTEIDENIDTVRQRQIKREKYNIFASHYLVTSVDVVLFFMEPEFMIP